MFIAHDETGNRINSLFKDETVLIKRTKNKEIYCPDCGKAVNFRSGTFKPHFYHPRNSNCSNLYSEPESETHYRGKHLLYNWLKKLFPSSKVELEWKIKETNQRSDVIVIHENGDRWAFEFQCSPITNEKWQERHNLYLNSGVIDFWILSSDINSQLDSEDDKFRFFKSLEKSIYSTREMVYYLDVQEEAFYMVRGGVFTTKTIIKGAEHFLSVPITEVEIEGLELWCDRMLRFYADDRYINKVANNLVLLNLVSRALELIKIEEERKLKVEQNNIYRTLADQRNLSFNTLTKKESHIFRELCSKHGFTLKTLPGFFFFVKPASVITPMFLIQLWLYDRVVFAQSTIQKKNEFPTLWAPNCLKEIRKLKSAGGLRVRKYTESGVIRDPYIEVVDTILELWDVVGVIKRLGVRDRFYHEIQCDQVPPHNSLKESLFTEWFYTRGNYNTQLPDEVRKATRVYESYISDKGLIS